MVWRTHLVFHRNCHSKQTSKETIEETMMAFAPFGLSEPWLVEYQAVLQLPMNKRQVASTTNQLESSFTVQQHGQWLLELR